ncbi:NAD-dependent epimerase/dehydratase family protein [Gordoniibacillus kamchatkensis]|uniref:NAD-dependent epimerase/dehydratase family protein n=1 Tax=Gordoniibacillus kamchatkensis TaxID=1590651 RepID=UPI0009E2DF5E|nr:NAD-dependent epimerase/dehydratase family protein [Paenibacillus sp. VKM B-2647]
MTTVFITGATGYIGSAIARAFIAAGYTVKGLARSEAARERLLDSGVQPVSGSMADISLLRGEAAASDGVIHAAVSHGADSEALDKMSVEDMLAGLTGSGKPFIYSNGTLVYNDTRDRILDEDDPLDPIAPLRWRAEQESVVLDASAAGFVPSF